METYSSNFEVNEFEDDFDDEFADIDNQDD